LIISIIPEYIDAFGDCCRVYTSEGDKVYNKKMQSVIKELYRERFIDFESVKCRVSELLNQKNLNPLYIGDKEILIPIKTRKPLVSKDSTYGYINAYEIQKIVDKQIYIKGKLRISFLDTKRILSRRIKMVKILEEGFSKQIFCYESKNFFDPGIASLVDYMFKEIGNIKMMMDRFMKLSLGF
jgi:hypothetical protein